MSSTSPPPHLLSDVDIVPRTRSASNYLRQEKHRVFNQMFSPVLTNHQNRQIAAGMADMKRQVAQNAGKIENTLQRASSLDCRANGIGSRGGHIARELKSPGPLNGNFKAKKGEFFFEHIKHFRELSSQLEMAKMSKVRNPDWRHQFINHNSLQPQPLFKHPKAVNRLIDLEAPVKEAMKARGLRTLPPARPVLHKGRRTDTDSQSRRAAGLGAYKVLFAVRAGSQTSSMVHNMHGHLDDDSVDWDTWKTGLKQEQESRPNTAPASLSLHSPESSTTLDDGVMFRQSVDDLSLSPTCKIDYSGAVDEGLASLVCTTLEDLLRELDDIGQQIQLSDLAVAAESIADPTVLPFVSYIAVLAGLSPSALTAANMLTKHPIATLMFIRGVFPIRVNIRRIKKASALMDQVIRNSWLDQFAEAPYESKLHRWVHAFDVIAQTMLAVNRIRRGASIGDKSPTSMSQSVAESSLFDPTSCLSDGLSALEEGGDGVGGNSSSSSSPSFLTDVGGESSSDERFAVEWRYCVDLCRDQTCLEFWRRVYAPRRPNSEDIVTHPSINSSARNDDGSSSSGGIGGESVCDGNTQAPSDVPGIDITTDSNLPSGSSPPLTSVADDDASDFTELLNGLENVLSAGTTMDSDEESLGSKRACRIESEI